MPFHSFTWQASSECQARGCAAGTNGDSHGPYLEAQNEVPRKDPSHRGGDEGRQASFLQPGEARWVPGNALLVPSGKEHTILSAQTHFQQTARLASSQGVAVEKRGRGLAGKNPFNQA